MSWETTKPVIVPIDFSGMSVDAIKTALRLAADPKSVHVLHVVPVLDQIGAGMVGWALPTDEERNSSVQEHFREFLAEHGFTHLREIILQGQPGEEIAEYAAKVEAGVIVIPSHGYHGVKRLLLGSVAEKVVRLATCPVFILRRDDAE
ncbi:universal stress protein [Fuerstiella marisgermanici]|uniref:Stress response protein NhaX n=1 Tax=Fuerstiella marisgermanici TaxID=1891926 RepID=A0A1P8WGC0_9PLAN|nr:universal stress protein [Fuerstiella marisgermanici]APZ93108.1 Stress response protein NhaX [Fuerstiella marisgermanici]